MKRVASVLVLIVSMTLLPTMAAASVKAGQACKKAGTKQSSNGLTYTCIKSGQRLVWSKGVRTAIRPVVSVIPKSAVEKWRELNSGSTTAWDQWKPPAGIGKSGTHTLPMSFTFHESVPQNVRDEVTRQYRVSGVYWDQYLDYDLNTQVIFSMYGNGRFVCEERGKALGQVVGPDYDCSNWTSSNFVAGSTPISPRLGSRTALGEMNWYVLDKYESLSSAQWRPRLHHEFMHTIAYTQNPDHWWTNACWFEEGWAEWFGVLIQSEGNEDRFYSLRNKTALGSAVYGYGRFSDSSKLEDWTGWLEDTSITKFSDTSPGDGCGIFKMDGIYNSATLGVEYLVVRFGVPRILAFQKDVAALGWTSALEKLFGKSRIEAYIDIATYMRSEYLLAAKNYG